MVAVSYMTNLQIAGSGSTTLYVNGTIGTNAFSFPASDGSVGQYLCTNGTGTLGWGVGGGSVLWADGTSPYIIPCNSCGVCAPIITASTCFLSEVFNGITSASCALIGCMCASTRLLSPYVCGNCICSTRRLVLPVGTNCY